MNILALDTSTKDFSVVIAWDETILAKRTFHLKKLLDSSIMPSIQSVLKKAELNLKDCDCLAIGVGPGSFTSLRVGVSTVKALSMATKKPIIACSSLDLIALNVQGDVGHLCVISDAKRKLLYSVTFQKQKGMLKRNSPYDLCSVDDVLKQVADFPECTFAGDGIVLYQERIEKEFKGIAHFAAEKTWQPKAENLISAAISVYKKKKFISPEKLLPMYLYPHDCQVYKKK